MSESGWIAQLREEYGAPEDHARTILAELKKLGAGYMEAEYEGGNDEGGVTAIRLYESTDANARYLEGGRYLEGSGLIEKPLEYDSPLWAATDAFLATQYWSWAGEFTANGTVYATVADRHVWSEGSEMVYSDSPRTLDVEVGE